MADYYPLLARAVGGLPESNGEARRAVYERARKALLNQLRSIQPPIAEADIERENTALDAAIARLEAEIAGRAAVESISDLIGAPAAEPKPPEAAPPPTKPAEAKSSEFKSAAFRPAEPKPLGPALPPEAGVPDARPSADAPPQAKAAAGAGAAKPGASVPLPPGGTGPQEGPRVRPFSFGAPKPSVAETQAERAQAAVDAAAVVESAEARDDDALEPPRPREAPRPVAPGPAQQPQRGNRLWIVGGVVVGVLLLVAGLAIKLKGRPEDLARLRPAPTETAETPKNGKIVERVGGGQPAAPPAAPAKSTSSAASSPAQTGAPAQPAAPQQPSGSQAPIPVAHRAALLIEAPETQEKVKTYIGSVVWRLDNVPGGPGKPLGTAIHADVDIPDAKVRMSLDIQKNADETLNASHTIEIHFTLLGGSAIPGIKQIGAIQMRREDSVNGDPLAGVPVQITDNYFLVGLQRGDMEARNVDLLKNRGWLDVPLALSNGRIAKFSLEKGVSGERVFADALKVWGEGQ